MNTQNFKQNFLYKIKHFKSLDYDSKKMLIDEIVLWSSLIIVFPLMIIHLIFMFDKNVHMPFWFEWFSFILCSIVTWTCGYSFFILAYKEIFKWHRLGMNTLIAVASLVAYFYSFYPLILNTINYSKNLMGFHNFDFSHTAAMIVTIVKAGDTISDKLKAKSTNDIEKIAMLQVKDCFLYDLKTKKAIPIETNKVKVGDYLLVKKGNRIPVDGIIYDGETDVDESMLTGESKPVHKHIKSKVIGSTNNLTSPFIMIATAVGKDTVVSNIIYNVKKIASNKPKYQKIVDRISSWFTPFVICLSLLAFFLHVFVPNIDSIAGIFNNWFNISQQDFNKYSLAIFYAVGTLSIACPCALGIAAPAANLVGASKAAKNGIIINTPETYEKIKKIDVIAFDKTGTLTEGKFNVTKIYGDLKNINIIYELEKNSIHPLATSFVKYCEQQNIKNNMQTFKMNDVKEIAGVGICGKNDKDTFLVCSLDYAKKNNFVMDKKLNDFTNNQFQKLTIMNSIVCFVKNNIIENIIIFEDKISDNAIDTIMILKKMNIKTCIISGDNLSAVEFAANKLNVDEYYADIKPDQKCDIIKKLQENNKVVAYVGDGINDLEALKQANLSIAISKENSLAQSISDITILNNDIISILKAIEITKATRKMIIFNLIWAFAYNIVTLPLSIIGFIPAFIGVFIMATSDMTVVGNTLIFKFKKIRYIPKKYEKFLINKKIYVYLNDK